jgi:UDPglucose 6-dehydrogenase
LDRIDLLWVTYDTPVDSNDRADVGFVLDRVERVLPLLSGPVRVLISSQLPVGTTRALEEKYRRLNRRPHVSFAYSPENLRLGNAIASFTHAERVVVGVRNDEDRNLLERLFTSFAQRIEFMSIESAEMTKHALNAFLATSVSFINEVAVICEHVGADAKEVERGLKSEPRIGARAYLAPGNSFAGATLARDIRFLTGLANDYGVSPQLLEAVYASNSEHRRWTHRKITRILGDLRSQTIAVWGLAYKVGTDTLRRSDSVELCEWLFDQGARIRAHDPIVKTLPEPLSQKITLCETAADALERASGLVVTMAWPEYGLMGAAKIVSLMQSAIVFDPNRFLRELETDPSVRYFTVGKP